MEIIKDEDAYPEEIFDDPHSNDILRLFRGTWLTSAFFSERKTLEHCLKFKLDPSDILVTSFPKSGTTWTQEIVYRIKTANDLKLQNQINGDKTKAMQWKFPMLEEVDPGVEEIAKSAPPRLIKTHLPFHLLPADAQRGVAKIIYIARNPMDVCVSIFHFLRELKGWFDFTGEFQDIFDNFMSGKVFWGPWKDHITAYWNRREDDNMLFLTYEEMHKNHHQVVKRVAEFLEVSLTDHQVEEIVQGTKFDSMKKDESLNYIWWTKSGRASEEFQFMRKGEVGDWKNYFTDEMAGRMEKELLEPLRALNLTFVHEDVNSA